MSFLDRVKAASGGEGCCRESATAATLDLLKDRVRQAISAERLSMLMAANPELARNELRSACRLEFLKDEWADVPADSKNSLVEDLVDLVFGLGPIEALLADEEVTEVLVNGTSGVFFEKGGVLRRSDVVFSSDDQVRNIIDRIIGPLGRRIDESSPMVSARLPRGHRVHAVIPPIAVDGPLLSIRAFSQRAFTLEDMVEAGSMDESLRRFLVWAVRSRKNIAVVGGTGSGKTTLLNALSFHISPDERVITIEDSAELRFLGHRHVVRLEAREPNAEGAGEVTIRDLVANSLRMRPDRIVVGECRGGEALDMLQAMNTGHSGSLTTLHANAPSEAVMRLATMVRYVAELPIDVIEAQIASAIDLFVQMARTAEGKRFVSHVATVSFDWSERRCCTVELFARKPHEAHGKWAAAPKWVEDLSVVGIASREEVDEWMRLSHLAA